MSLCCWFANVACRCVVSSLMSHVVVCWFANIVCCWYRLQDIILDDDIKLDSIFINSLVADIVEVRLYTVSFYIADLVYCYVHPIILCLLSGYVIPSLVGHQSTWKSQVIELSCRQPLGSQADRLWS